MNRDSSLQFAIDYANKKGYKTENRQFNLHFHKPSQKLCWFISFMQESADGVIEYKTLVIDVKQLMVVEETEMFEYGKMN